MNEEEKAQDEVARDETAGEDTAASRAEEAEMMERLQEEIRNLPVSDHLLYMLHSLSALAVGRMGLSADTQVQRDLGQARLAIEAFKALLGVVEQVRPGGESSVHRGTLSQLQMAYVDALETPRRDDSGTVDSDTADAGAGSPPDSDEAGTSAADDVLEEVQPDSGRPTE
jgi:hypothetical protein